MALSPKGYNQISSPAAAVGLGQGISIAASVVPAAGGTGYKLGDILTLSGGTFQRVATVRVLSVDAAGKVLTAAVQASGVYTSKPGNAVATTGGSGNGAATFTVTWSDNTVPQGADFATLSAEAFGIRWRDDGIAPTASVGNLLPVGQSVSFGPAQVNRVQLIQAAAGGIANIDFYLT